MLIRNYGLFWRRNDVWWGRQNVQGHLKGVRATALTSRAVDFAEQRGVYALYDDAFHLVYVGQAGANDNQRMLDRLRNHRRDALADRRMRFSWFGVNRVLETGELAADAAAAHPAISDVLNHIEAILITAAEPAHNRQGGRFGDGVEQYLQHRDEEHLGPTVDEMIRGLWGGSAPRPQ
jgi:hypothetical protein